MYMINQVKSDSWMWYVYLWRSHERDLTEGCLFTSSLTRRFPGLCWSPSDQSEAIFGLDRSFGPIPQGSGASEPPSGITSDASVRGN